MIFRFSISRFKRQLAFAVACCLLPVNFSCAQTAATPATQTQAAPRALWVWDASAITQNDVRKDLLDFCRAKKIGVVYIHLGDFLNPTKRAEDDRRHVTKTTLGDFLEAAHAQKIRVEALDGDPSFAQKANHAAALQRVKLALDYNREATSPRRLDGFQWDIEPYILPAWKDETQRENVAAEFLDVIKQTRDLVMAGLISTDRNIAGANGFSLGFALPFWMDSEAQNVTWSGEKKPATFHALQTLAKLPNSYIALMAYRDKAEGDNGTIAVVRDEMEYAAKQTPQVKVVIGQETGEVKSDPTSITFYEEGEAALENAIAQSSSAYANSPVFGGVAIHHWKSYADLIERLPATAAATPQNGIALSISSPIEGANAGLNQDISGKAQGGTQVQLSVKPEGDIWYEGKLVPVAPDGSWSASVRLGNDKTPVGKRFQVRAQLLGPDGAKLQEKIIGVVRQ